MTTVLESIPETLGAAEPWVENGGVLWLNYPDLNVREVAKAMNAV